MKTLNIFFISLSIVAVALLTACSISINTTQKDLPTKVFTLASSIANVYIVQTKGKTIMIDCSVHGQEEKLEKAFKKINLDPKTIDYLILTHGHPDHSGNVAYFQTKYGIKVIAGKGDQPLIEKGVVDTLCPTNGMAKLVKSFTKPNYPQAAADIWVEGEMDLKKLGIDGIIIEQPGHTLGSLVVMIENKAFVGDLIRGQPLNKDNPTLHYFMCDLEGNRQNIQQLLDYEQLTVWYPGHFGALETESIRAKFGGK